MIQVMSDARGVGLAAPQLGSLRRLAVVYAGEDTPPLVLCNPEITWRSAEQEIDTEGCLSIGEIAVEVERSLAIHVVAQDVDGPVRVRARRLRRAGDPARDGPPRRRPDPRPNDARAAPGGPQGAPRRGLTRRARRLRGQPGGGGRAPARPGRLPPRARPGRHAARPRPRQVAPAVADARRPGRPGARGGGGAAGHHQRSRGHRADRRLRRRGARRRGLRPDPARRRPLPLALRQRALLAAPGLPWGRPRRARADGRRHGDRRDDHADGRRARHRADAGHRVRGGRRAGGRRLAGLPPLGARRPAAGGGAGRPRGRGPVAAAAAGGGRVVRAQDHGRGPAAGSRSPRGGAGAPRARPLAAHRRDVPHRRRALQDLERARRGRERAARPVGHRRAAWWRVCGGSLEILELQPPGRGRMVADAFLRGWRGELEWGVG